MFPHGELQCYQRKGNLRVLPRAEGRCVFLEEERTCFLHRVFGANIKPNACVEFPYTFVETPAGTYVGLSFVCRSVREAVGRAAEEGSEPIAILEELSGEYFAEVEEAYRRSRQDPARKRTVPESIRLQEGIALSWDEYVLVEEGLLSVLSMPGRTLQDRLVAGEVFLGLLGEYVRATAATENESKRREVLKHYVASMHEEKGDRLFRIAAKIRPNNYIRQVVTSLFRSFAKASEAQSRSSRTGPLRVAFTWGWELTQKLLRSAKPPALDPVEEAVLASYVRHVVWRKGLLVGASPYFTGVVRRGYAHLLVTVALILEQWGREEEPRCPALLDAIGNVERDFVVHGAQRGEVPVQELISRYRFPLHLLDNLTHRRIFARAMVG